MRPARLRSNDDTARPTVVVTGFGPFPDVQHNVSATLVSALADEAGRHFPDYQFAAVHLPTEWHTAPRIMADVFTKHRPVLILHFGVTAEAVGFRIETDAVNSCRLAEDASGNCPRSDILLADGPAKHNATIPVVRIVTKLTSLGYPAVSSSDAGSYLCNAVLYHSLDYALANDAHCRIGFVHIPRDLSGPPLTFVNALSGSLTILRCCLDSRDASAVNTSRSGARLA